MTLVVLGIAGVIIALSFITWRAMWMSSLPRHCSVEEWRHVDAEGRPELPEAVQQAVFEGCSMRSSGDQFVFQVMGSPAVPISLDDHSSHWAVARSVPEMLAMYGLQYAACCLRKYAESRDERWLDKFDKALDRAESGARRCLWSTFFPWTEHAVALRMTSSRYCMRMIVRMTDTNSGRAENRLRYERILRIHLSALKICKQPWLYDYVTNHGLITDSALIQCAPTWPESYPLANSVMAQVRARTESATQYFVSPDGVPLEPATSYWYLIRRLLNDIKQGLDRAGMPLSDMALSRLTALDKFLAETNMDGSVQRFGDSSGGHCIEMPFVPPPRPDGATLRVYDTGLVLLNVVMQGRVVAQLMVNGQDIRPRVHAQQDAGALAFYAREKFWFNSPGSFTAMPQAKRQSYVCSENQSTVVQASGYDSRCELVSVEETASEYIVVLRIAHRFTRRLVIARMGFRLKAEDTVADGSVLTSAILLAPTCLVLVRESGLMLQDTGKELAIETKSSVALAPGHISYHRNDVLETKSLRLSGRTVWFSITLPEYAALVVKLAQKPAAQFRSRRCSWRRVPAQLLRGLSMRKLQLWLAICAAMITGGLFMAILTPATP